MRRTLSPSAVRAFRKKIYEAYRSHKRPMPWRWINDAWGIFVSEVMLQQTQVERVMKKYVEFMAVFPTIPALADARPAEVLAVWQGMGYNRRAVSLQRAARMILDEFGGAVPRTVEELQRLPGIGPATARSIAVFAYDEPAVFIETNVRSVFIHEFFAGRDGVTDGQILPLVERTLDRDRPREWYYALMDYGVVLKKQHGNPGRRSAHYVRQSRFEGSDRQLRGKVVKVLVEGVELSAQELRIACQCDAGRLEKALASLVRDGLVRYSTSGYRI